MSAKFAAVDTDVVVAGLLTADPEAPTARIVDAMLVGRFPFLLSTELLAEYRAVLLRPRVRERHGLTEVQVDRILAELTLNAAVREPPPSKISAPEPGDQHLWDLLVLQADAVLVTGDRELLASGTAPGQVVSPRDAAARLEGVGSANAPVRWE